jgi:hypothetical protein
MSRKVGAVATIVSVHSFRGGTGKSNTTANLAVVLAAEGRRVGVIDTDIQSPGIHILFGLAGEAITASLNDFLWHGRDITDAARDVTPNLGASHGGLASVFRTGWRQAAIPACARVSNCTGLRYPSVECRRWRVYQTSMYSKIATWAAARVGQSWRSTSSTLSEAKNDSATALS